MRTIVAIALGLLLNAGPTAPAAADVPGVDHARAGVTPTSKCVSGYELNNLKRGTPRARAEKFLDGPGRADGYQIRAYRSCAYSWHVAQVGVRYVDGRVFDIIRVRVPGGGMVVPDP